MAKTTQTTVFDLRPDTKGAIWDLVLYIPTVLALASVGAKLWFAQDQGPAYLLIFLACFFALVGGNRVLKTRLLILPTAPIRLVFGTDYVQVGLRHGATHDLLKGHKLYADMAGKSFGVGGLNAQGQRLSFVFHLANFANEQTFDDAKAAFKRLETRLARAAA